MNRPNLMLEFFKHIFTPDQLRVLFLVSYGFLVFTILILLGTLVAYLYFLFQYYPRCLEKVLIKNGEGGVLHQLSYGWIKGVTLTPIPDSGPEPKSNNVKQMEAKKKKEDCHVTSE